jgi:putative membrane protein
MTHEALGETLAMVNALLNGTSAVCIVLCRVAIARKRPLTHRAFMIGAFAASTVFLATYLTRVFLTGTHVDPHTGWFHWAYLAVLMTHMLLAMAVVPLVLRTLWLAYKRRFEPHRRIARVTFPVWLYVSVTGVLVYVMLYRVPA